MTREEALIITNELMYGEYDNFTSPIDLINKIYDYFEERIAELESPKTCDGCVLIGSNTCIYCSRKVTIADFYEPKEVR